MVLGRNPFSHGLVSLLCKTNLKVGNLAMLLQGICPGKRLLDGCTRRHEQVHYNIIHKRKKTLETTEGI